MDLSLDLLRLTWHHKSSLAGSLILLALVYRLFIRPNYVSSIANVPGPKSRNPITGNLPEIFKAEAAALHTTWVNLYGSVIKYRGFLGDNRLYVTDPVALRHILLTRSYDYPKPYQTRHQMARILGKGILFAEGDDHKRQKRVLNQAFTWNSVNSYLPIFQEQSNKLRHRITAILEEPATNGVEVRGEYAVIDVCSWLSRTTLDIIGLAGFSYSFNQIEKTGGENELANVFRELLQPGKITIPLVVLQIIGQYIPIVAKIPTKAGNAIQRSMDVMQGEGQKMLDIRRKQAAAGDLEDKMDLLSLIVKANMDTVNKKDRLLDSEIMGQITTFLLAGHETSIAVTWILLFMAQKPDIQTKLREEIRTALAHAIGEGRSALTAEELNTLPYLDAVVRETMRCAPPVHLTVREAAEDDVIPISEPIKGANGKTLPAITVQKGQTILIGIFSMNHSKAIFGEDADQYRPERWLDDDLESRVKGFTTWAPLLSFLGGPRGCIGWRMAVLEVKTILATLIDAFEYLERDEGGTPMTKKSSIVTRPVVIGEEDKGAQLPLRIRKAAR